MVTCAPSPKARPAACRERAAAAAAAETPLAATAQERDDRGNAQGDGPWRDRGASFALDTVTALVFLRGDVCTRDRRRKQEAQERHEEEVLHRTNARARPIPPLESRTNAKRLDWPP